MLYSFLFFSLNRPGLEDNCAKLTELEGRLEEADQRFKSILQDKTKLEKELENGDLKTQGLESSPSP